MNRKAKDVIGHATDATSSLIKNNQSALKVQQQVWRKVLVVLCAMMTIMMMFPSVVLAETTEDLGGGIDTAAELASDPEPAATADTTSATTTDAATTPASDSDEQATTTILPAATPTADSSLSTSSSTTIVMVPDVVLIHGSIDSAWAVLNIILTVAGLLCATSLIISYLVQCRQNEEGEKKYYHDQKNAADRQYDDYPKVPAKRLWPRLVNVVLALSALMMFVIAENTALPMVWWDQWTTWHIIIFALIVVLTIVAIIRKKPESADYQKPQQPSQNESVAQM